MSTDMVTLYERILALVPVDELKDGYNAVLSEEISSTNRAVNDVVTAFAKLQEVREAVRQVQQESTGTRSASLTNTMNATMALQEKLHKAMELTSAEMTKLRGKRKAIGDCVGERGRKVPKHQAKSEVTVQAASSKQDIQQVKPKMNEERKVPWASELTVENCLERLRMMTQLPVDERSKHIPSVLSKLQSFISVNDVTKQMVILKIVVLWAVLSAEHHDSLSAYDCFCKHTAVTINDMSDKYPGRRVKAELKRLNNTLRAILIKSEKRSSDGSVDTNAFYFRSYELVIWRVDTMDPNERAKHIPEILRSLKSEILQDSKPWTKAKTKVAEHLIKALRVVRQWVEAIPDEAVISSMFGDLVEHMGALVDKISVFNQKVGMYSEMQNFMRISGNPPSGSGQAQVKRLLRIVKQLDDQSATSEIDSCIFLFADVALRRERSWNPRQDPTLKECYDYLMKRMKSQEFSKRMKREGFSEFSQKERINVMEQFMGVRATSYVAFK